MWRRREEIEIHDINRSIGRRKARLRFAYFVILPLVIFFALGFLDWIGVFDAKWGRPPPNISFTDAMLRSIPLSFVAMLLVVGLRQLRGDGSATPRVICTRCQKTMSRSSSELCDCGGRLEPVDYWRWTDDQPQHT